MSDIKYWSTTASENGTTGAAPDWWPEGMAPSAVNNAAREMMRATREFYSNIEWREFGDATGTNDCHTVAYASATTFTTSAGDGDTTAVYHEGRRVRAVGSSTGTIYGRIASSTGDPTTVTVVWDSGSLSSESLTISLGPSITGTPLGVGFVHVATYTASSDTAVEIFHDGIENSGSSLVAGYEYALRIECFSDGADDFYGIQTFSSSYRTGSTLYSYNYQEQEDSGSMTQTVSQGGQILAFNCGLGRRCNTDMVVYNAADSGVTRMTCVGAFHDEAAAGGHSYSSRGMTDGAGDSAANTKFRIIGFAGTEELGGTIKLYRRKA